MAFVLGDLNVIDSAIKTGRRKVKYGDKEVEYRSLEEMMQARSFIEGQLKESGALASSARPTSTSFASFSRE